MGKGPPSLQPRTAQPPGLRARRGRICYSTGQELLEPAEAIPALFSCGALGNCPSLPGHFLPLGSRGGDWTQHGRPCSWDTLGVCTARGAAKSALPPWLLPSARPPASGTHSHLPSLTAGTRFSHPLSLTALETQGSGCDQVSLGPAKADLRVWIHSFYCLKPERRVYLGPPLRLHPCATPILHKMRQPLCFKSHSRPFQEAFQECASAHRVPLSSP